MELTEHIAAFLRANGFPDATSGAMPPEPDRAVAFSPPSLADEPGSASRL